MFLKLQQLFGALTINLKTSIFQCSKNYGIPCVTKLQVAPNMANQISIKDY